MIENEIKVIYMNLEEQIKEDILSYLMDNELINYGGYSVAIYGNIENNKIYYRYEIDAPELVHFYSEWFCEDFTTYTKPFTTVDYLDAAALNRDVVIQQYGEDDFRITA
jgi:hypothetical protein